MPTLTPPAALADVAAQTIAGVDDISRRWFLAGGASTLALLAGCGSDAAAPKRTGSGRGEFPVTVTDAFGSVTVDRPPRHIVSAGRTDHDTLLALGVIPSALYRFVPVMRNGVGDWAESALHGAHPKILTSDLNFELIASLSPDLIVDVQSLSDAKRHATLHAIATTLGRPKGSTPNAVPWQQATEFIATALGRKQDGQALVSRVTTFLRARADQNPHFASASVAVVLAYGNNIGVYAANDTRMQLLHGLGFEPSPFVTSLGTHEYFVPVSPERLGEIDADVVVVLNQAGQPASTVRHEFPTLDATPASKAGRTVYVTQFQVALALSNTSVLSIPYAVKSLEPLLAKALA